MKILLLTHIFPPAVDGGSKVIVKIGEYFANHGHQVRVLASNASSTDDFSKFFYKKLVHPNYEVFGGPFVLYSLSVITLLHRPLKLLSRYFSILKPLSKGPLFNPLTFFISLISIIKYQPDLIIAGPLPTTIVIYARLIRFLTKALTHHRSKVLINASYHPTDSEFHSPLLINTLKSADYLWTLSNFETNYFHQNFGIEYKKMFSLGNGIDTNFLSSKVPKFQRSDALLYVGSFSQHKKIDTLIDSFALLSKDLSLNSSKALSLTLAGTKTLYSPIIESKIKSLPKNIRNKIKVIYNFDSKALKLLLAQSSVLILPSSQESFGLVLLEAWARGKPVITSDIPPLQELIDKSGGGLTFKLNNYVDLSTQIHTILNSKILYSKLQSQGYLYSSRHTWDRIGDTLCQKLSSLSSSP